MNGKSDWFELRPRIGNLAMLAPFVADLAAPASGPEVRAATLRRLRSRVSNGGEPLDDSDLGLQTVQNLLLDLAEQGWELQVEQGSIKARPASVEHPSPSSAKEWTRRAHLIERNLYLDQPAVRDFTVGMELRRLTPHGWHSIYSLMRDGQQLASRLARVASISNPSAREAGLAEAIDPYLQFIEPGATCEQTGLALNDIWRYFRLTWVNVPRSVPGRSVLILVRDRAAPNHPVIGIAALSSSVVQQGLRDRWIGWQGDDFVACMEATPTGQLARWLLKSVASLIDGVYVSDLLKGGVCKERDLRYPEAGVIERLRDEAARAKQQHHLYPDATGHKTRYGGWENAARTNLFRSKRCEALARLLSVRHAFNGAGLTAASAHRLSEAFRSPAFRSAASQLVRLIKAEHVGIDMMDISVCGAIPPYNRLLGGKLVCAMLMSPEVSSYYNARYAERESVIASSMKGAPVKRRARLVLLCTTSLYGVGSSQYNRLKIPADEVGGQVGEVLEFKRLGLSKGFGSFHFSTGTIALINILLGRRVEGRRVNSIFGEGVNPLMRKIREALDLLGLPSDLILNHGNPRLVYGVALAENFREVLLGRTNRPKYFLPSRKPSQATDALASFWRKRWLSQRVSDPQVLLDIAENTLSYPVAHGARVPVQGSGGLGLFGEEQTGAPHSSLKVDRE